MSVAVYSLGLVSCSVCAPREMTRDEVEAAVNVAEPTGISSEWRVSDEPTFSGGQPNPCPCEQQPESHVHYLMHC